MFIGKEYTKKSDQFLNSDKEYIATLFLGVSTDTYDLEGKPDQKSSHIPSLSDVSDCIASFQGEIEQIPPMYSAKKIKGKKLYELARKGITVERAPRRVKVEIELLSYEYPELKIRVKCSKGTYIRSLGSDIGLYLKTYAHLTHLNRTKSGAFTLEQSIPQEKINDPNFNLKVIL